MTSAQLESEIAKLKAQIEALQAQHADMLLLAVTHASFIHVLSKFARQQGAKFTEKDLSAEAREVLLRIEDVSPEAAAALDAELAKFFATDDPSP